MGSHDPFGHFKHKLWPKEGLGVKLPIWLLTVKSQGLPLLPCMQVACNILLESCRRRLQICCKPHFNWRIYTQNYGPPKLWKSQLWEFWNSHLGVLGQNDIWMMVPWPSTKYTIRGKVVAFPKSGPWWVLWIHVCLWFVRAPKAFKLHTNQLVVWIVQVHVSNWCLSFFLVPILQLQHTPLPQSGAS
jgi:hypothetical protein